MRRDIMLDRIIICIASILLIVGIVVISETDNVTDVIVTDIPDLSYGSDTVGKSYIDGKVCRYYEIDELVSDLRTVQYENHSKSTPVSIDIQGLPGGVEFTIGMISHIDDSKKALKDIVDSEKFKCLESYTDENIQKDILEFFEYDNELESVSKVYSDTNTSFKMTKDRYGNREYQGYVTIRVFDYCVGDTGRIGYGIDEHGYRPIINKISKDILVEEMMYKDIGYLSEKNGVCIVDGKEVNGVQLDLMVSCEYGDVKEVSILARAKANNPEDITIAAYQSNAISSVVEELGIRKEDERIKAEKEIRGLLFKSNTTQIVPKTITICGCEVAYSYVVENMNLNNEYEKTYNTRIDLKVKKYSD